MITIAKYNQIKNQIDWSKLPKLKKLKADIEDIMPFYNDDKDVKDAVDMFLKQLPDVAKKPATKKTPAKKTTKTAKQPVKRVPAKKKKTNAPKYKVGDYVKLKNPKNNPVYKFYNVGKIVGVKKQNGNIFYDVMALQDKGKGFFNEKELEKTTISQTNTMVLKKINKTIDKKEVDHYKAEFLLLRRFYNLITSKKPVTFKRIQLTFRAFEKAAIERKVRKTSPVADLFKKANSKLVKLYNATKENEEPAVIKITDTAFLTELEKYVKGYTTDTAVRLLKRFINFEGTTPEKTKVKRLLVSIDNAIAKGKVSQNHRLYKELIKAKKELENYLKAPKPKRIPAKTQGLNKPKKKSKNNPAVKKPVKTPKPNEKRHNGRVEKPKQQTQINGLKPLSQTVKEEFDTFQFNDDLGLFLGAIEKKQTGSVVFTMDAPQGAGKTRQMFQFANMFGNAGYKVLFYSLEEHPQSKLFADKVKQYLSPKAQQNIFAVGEISKKEMDKLIPQFDIMLADSWNKVVYELEKNENVRLDFDYDLRKKYNGKLFGAIFQRTVSGTMRGGSQAQFDGDVILKIKKMPDWKDNYVYYDKNRYMIDNYVWNIHEQRLYLFDDYMQKLIEKYGKLPK